MKKMFDKSDKFSALRARASAPNGDRINVKRMSLAELRARAHYILRTQHFRNISNAEWRTIQAEMRDIMENTKR